MTIIYSSKFLPGEYSLVSNQVVLAKQDTTHFVDKHCRHLVGEDVDKTLCLVNTNWLETREQFLQ